MNVSEQSIQAYTDYLASKDSLTELETVYQSLLELKEASARMLSAHSGVRINHLSGIITRLKKKLLIVKLQQKGFCTEGARFVYFYKVVSTDHLRDVEVRNINENKES